MAAPLTSNWPSGTVHLAVGGTLQLAPRVTAPDGFSTLKSWSITDEAGRTLASGTGTTPSLTVQTPTNEVAVHTLTLELTSDSGMVARQSFTYWTDFPTGVFTHLSASSVTRGSWVKLSASTWVKDAGKWSNLSEQGNLQYQWSVPGSTVWHNGSAYRTSSTSVPATWIQPGGDACFRAVWTPSGDYFPATSAPVCLTVKP